MKLFRMLILCLLVGAISTAPGSESADDRPSADLVIREAGSARSLSLNGSEPFRGDADRPCRWRVTGTTSHAGVIQPVCRLRSRRRRRLEFIVSEGIVSAGFRNEGNMGPAAATRWLGV